MKRKLLFTILCLLSFVVFTKAEETDTTLDSIIQDGNIYINELSPMGTLYTYSIESYIRSQYYEELANTQSIWNKQITVNSCSEDFTSCSITYSSSALTKELEVGIK